MCEQRERVYVGLLSREAEDLRRRRTLEKRLAEGLESTRSVRLGFRKQVRFWVKGDGDSCTQYGLCVFRCACD